MERNFKFVGLGEIVNIIFFILFVFSIVERIDIVDKDIIVIDIKVFVMYVKMKYKSVEGIKCVVMEWNVFLDIVEWLSLEELKVEDVEGIN